MRKQDSQTTKKPVSKQAERDSQTPLMTQYFRIKEANPDTILLFRVGDFFETFENDAKIASKVLGITLTKRANGAAEDVPLAGFPHHAIDSYLPKLVRAGSHPGPGSGRRHDRGHGKSKVCQRNCEKGSN